MKLLIVANAISIHTFRWLSQLYSTDWDILLFPALDYGRVHKGIENIGVFHSVYTKKENKNKNRYYGINLPIGSHIVRGILNKHMSFIQPLYLASIINKEKPDIVHIIEFQNSGYLYLKAKKYLKTKPKTILTNWGSDIYYFQKFNNHRNKIRKLLKIADYYTCECQRDVFLAEKYGFKGKTALKSPNAGGFNIGKLEKHKKPLSKRNLIALKGYQSWSGRALNGLKALVTCKDLIKSKGYQVAIYSHQNNPLVINEVENIRKKHGLDIRLISQNISHLDILKLHGRARISIGVSVTDGISTSLLESLVMESFPIQSNSSCADEWIRCGENGFTFSPEDHKDFSKKINRALVDDKLIKKAAITNRKIAIDKLNYEVLKQKAINMYESIHNE